jgi:hypothetical protein
VDARASDAYKASTTTQMSIFSRAQTPHCMGVLHIPRCPTGIWRTRAIYHKYGYALIISVSLAVLLAISAEFVIRPLDELAQRPRVSVRGRFILSASHEEDGEQGARASASNWNVVVLRDHVTSRPPCLPPSHHTGRAPRHYLPVRPWFPKELRRQVAHMVTHPRPS